MKKSKKVVISAGGKKALIDATNKQSISIVPMHENSSFLELEKELQEMNDSIERIRQKYYTTDATLQRIQSRTLRCRLATSQGSKYFDIYISTTADSFFSSSDSGSHRSA